MLIAALFVTVKNENNLNIYQKLRYSYEAKECGRSIKADVGGYLQLFFLKNKN